MPLRTRRSNPPRYSTYQRYKGVLREDFSYRCVYCDIHENESGGPRYFSVEHFRPKKRFPELRTEYRNLLYACTVCNSYKSDDWPSETPLDDGRGYLDPTEHDYDDHFALSDDDLIVGLSAVGHYMIQRMRLNRKMLQKIRALRREEEQQHTRILSLLERSISAIDIVLEREQPTGKAGRALRRERDELRKQYEAQVVSWGRRWEPLFNLEDY
jgi:5-methylcytosine-specific restriction endonuclease McrA